MKLYIAYQKTPILLMQEAEYEASQGKSPLAWKRRQSSGQVDIGRVIDFHFVKIEYHASQCLYYRARMDVGRFQIAEYSSWGISECKSDVAR